MLDWIPKDWAVNLACVVCTVACVNLMNSNLFRNLLFKLRNSSTFFDPKSKMKMILVVREDLKMGKGKIAAQCAHAAVEGYIQIRQTQPELLNAWLNSGQMKVVLKVTSEMELLQLYQACKQQRINTCYIQDAGHTQVAPGTKTVLCIGPAPAVLIDSVSGHLKLL